MNPECQIFKYVMYFPGISGINLALHANVTMSSEGDPSLATDGLRAINYDNCTHTLKGDLDRWLVVDLGQEATVSSVHILNRVQCGMCISIYLSACRFVSLSVYQSVGQEKGTVTRKIGQKADG